MEKASYGHIWLIESFENSYVVGKQATYYVESTVSSWTIPTIYIGILLNIHKVQVI